MKFVDYINPTRDEIRRWAFAAGDMYPCEDWDIIIAADAEHEDLFLELAGADTCPHRDMFLRILYLIVGDAVRTSWQTSSKAHIANLIRVGHVSGAAAVRLWATRSRELIENPSRFNYADWCDGRLARESSAG